MLPPYESPVSFNVCLLFPPGTGMSCPQHVTLAVTAIQPARLSEQRRFTQGVLCPNLLSRIERVINASVLSHWKRNIQTLSFL